ncbi:MAG: DUF932 domain-containing protein [Candidatus Tectomicrobia bacterium]|nr:DUF932 domain-containing protein [Candidatus Tectomicrobia bacterium]
MKSDLTLVELAQELDRQQHAKRDYLATETALEARTVPDDGGTRTVVLDIDHVGEHTLTPHAHGQIGTYLHIPKRYYNRMLQDAPELLCTNVNHWLHQHEGNQRLVRTLDGSVRGFLSTSYRALDHFEFAEAALQELHQVGDVQVESAAITDTRMYIKAVSSQMEGEVRKGDIVRWGIALSNSEVGAGKLRIDPLVYRMVCTNGAVAREHVGTYSRRHVGSKVISNLDVSQLLSDEAREADDKAFWLATRDIIRAIFDWDSFQAILETWRTAATRDIKVDVPKVVEVTLKHHKLPETMHGGILDHLIRDGDLSQFGLGNALTRYSQDVESYETATQLEEIGADVMAMDERSWSRLTDLAKAMS